MTRAKDTALSGYSLNMLIVKYANRVIIEVQGVVHRLIFRYTDPSCCRATWYGVGIWLLSRDGQAFNGICAIRMIQIKFKLIFILQEVCNSILYGCQKPKIFVHRTKCSILNCIRSYIGVH